MEGIEHFNLFFGLFMGIVSFASLLIAAYKMLQAPIDALKSVERTLVADASAQDSEIAAIKRMVKEAREQQASWVEAISEIHTNVMVLKDRGDR